MRYRIRRVDRPQMGEVPAQSWFYPEWQGRLFGFWHAVHRGGGFRACYKTEREARKYIDEMRQWENAQTRFIAVEAP